MQKEKLIHWIHSVNTMYDRSKMRQLSTNLHVTCKCKHLE